MLYQQIYGEQFIYRYATTSPVEITKCFTDHFNIEIQQGTTYAPWRWSMDRNM
jgi:hypothetical protein